MATEIKGSFRICNFLDEAFNLGQSSDVFSCLTGSPTFPGKPQYPSNPFSPGGPTGPCLPLGPGGPGGPTMPRGPSHPGCPGLPAAPCIPLLPVVKKMLELRKFSEDKVNLSHRTSKASWEMKIPRSVLR